tara:strand:- start:611 stop:1492 length:882 start_codon:yes stop_codon:yes gene_type:complete
MSSEDLKNKILEKLSNTIQGGNLYNNMYDEDNDISTAVRIGGASAGSLIGGNKEIEKKLKQQTAPNLRKLILSKNIRGVTKMSKKELVDVIMENLDRFPEVHKLKNKPKKQLSESEKQVLRDRLAKARSMKKKGKSKTAKKIKVQEVDSEDEDDIISVLQDEDKFKQFEEDKNLYEHLFSKEPKAKAKKLKAKKKIKVTSFQEPKKKPKGIKITKSKTNRSNLLRKMKKEDLKKILKMGGIKGYSKLPKDDLVRVILENPQIYGGSFWSALKDVGSVVLDVGKTVAPFIPLIL